MDISRRMNAAAERAKARKAAGIPPMWLGTNCSWCNHNVGPLIPGSGKLMRDHEDKCWKKDGSN